MSQHKYGSAYPEKLFERLRSPGAVLATTEWADGERTHLKDRNPEAWQAMSVYEREGYARVFIRNTNAAARDQASRRAA